MTTHWQSILFVLLIILFLFLLSIPSIASPMNGFTDDFNSGNLDGGWSWYNEDSAQWSLSASPGNLRLIGSNHDMWQTCNNPKNLLLRSVSDTSFFVQTKIVITPTTNYQQAGLLFFQDVDNYVKLDVVWNTTTQIGLSVELIKESEGVAISAPNWPWVNVSTSTPIYLQMFISENSIVGYYSSDGIKWITVGSWQETTISNPQTHY